MFKEKANYLLYRWVFPYAGLLTVKLISLTNRIATLNPHYEQRLTDQGKGLIYISWHQRFFPGITFFATRKPIAIMISQSRDGEFISRIVKMLGWEPVRGSSSRGGPEALAKLTKLARSGYRIGHIVDGPKGPFGIIKPGLLKIAQTTGLPIVPAIMSAEKKWIFNSWDRFMIPKFFSRVIIGFGKPVYVHANLNKTAFEETRRRIESQMKRLDADTDRLWKDPEKIRSLFHADWEFWNFSRALKR